MLSSNRTTVTPTMQAADAAVLRLFYEATGGAAWFNRSGWDSDPVSCVADGVTCGYGGAVVGDAGDTLHDVTASNRRAMALQACGPKTQVASGL